MKGRPWLLLLVLVIPVAALVLLTPSKSADAPDHRSDSNGPNGTSALAAFAIAEGHPVDVLRGSSTPGSADRVAFAFSTDVAWKDEEVAALLDWVRAGGTLVYADEAGDDRLDARLGLHRYYLRDISGQDHATPELLPGVDRVEGSREGLLRGGFQATPDQVVLLRRGLASEETSGAGEPVAVEEQLGHGRVVALGDPLVLANGWLGRADNGTLAADLLGLAPAGTPVSFDEFHHGAASGTTVLDWVTTPWGLALAWLLVVLYLGLLLRGQAFGPRLAAGRTGERSSAEYAAAVGALLRRAGARAETLALLTDSTRRALTARVGLHQSVPDETLERVLAQRAPDLGGELARVTAAGTPASDRALLELARRLHTLAYPSAKEK